MPPTIRELLRATQYDLRLFSAQLIDRIQLSFKNGRPYLKCIIRGADKVAKPEEIVRQLYILKLTDEYGYPLSRITIPRRPSDYSSFAPSGV